MRAALLVVALLLGGCASIPDEGAVTEVEADEGLGGSTARYTPARPTPGSTPQQVVRGFLDAMLAYPVSTGVAEDFLTDEAAEGWKSTAGTEVYTRPRVGPLTAAGADAVEVRLATRPSGRLDAQGRWSPGGDRRDHRLRLVREDDEWRITNPPDALLVTEKFFQDYFRPFDVFFFDEPAERLVPDVVHLAVGDRLPTALVTSLTLGPRSSSAAARTFVPPTSELTPSVPVDDEGVADVEFGEQVAASSRRVQGRIAAQLVWTLRQVPGLTGVRIVGGSSVLSASGERVQPIESWNRYRPRPDAQAPYGLVGGRVVRVEGSAVRRVTERWAEQARGATDLAVGRGRAAVVRADEGTVDVVSLSGGEATVIGVEDVVTVRWVPGDVLLVVDRPGGGTRVRLVDGKDVRTLPVGRLALAEARSFAVSPEGGRYAVTVPRGDGVGIAVGAVVRDGDDRVVRLGDPVAVPLDVDDPRAVGWVGGTRLTFLAGTDAGVQVHEAPIDGSSLAGGAAGGGPLLPDVDARLLLRGPGDDPARWVVDERRRLWFLPPDGAWSLLDTPAVTSLTTTR